MTASPYKTAGQVMCSSGRSWPKAVRHEGLLAQIEHQKNLLPTAETGPPIPRKSNRYSLHPPDSPSLSLVPSTTPRYPAPHHCTSVIRAWRPEENRRNPSFGCGRFCVPVKPRYDGLCRDFFGSAGFPISRSANLVQPVTLTCLAAGGDGF